MALGAILILTATSSGFAQSTAPARAAAKPQRAVTHPVPAAPIVCTKYGCRPLPPNCHAEREDTWEGPTGYQIIVCP